MSEKDHPELDTSELLDSTGIKQYQSLIGDLQWLITLGRFDIHLCVTTLSGYRVAPRQGHLYRRKRTYGHLKRHPDGAIRFRRKIPDHESIVTPIKHDWASTVYSKVKEELPPDIPPPKGKAVRTSHYQDANLYHDLVTGQAMSGILHLVNQTPDASFCKKQQTVETATYGSEFTVARQSCEQIIDLRYTLRMMVIPIDGPACSFGDNMSVIMSSTIRNSTINKHHHTLPTIAFVNVWQLRSFTCYMSKVPTTQVIPLQRLSVGLSFGLLYNHYYFGKGRLFSPSHSRPLSRLLKRIPHSH
jgi:hypothetical protein